MRHANPLPKLMCTGKKSDMHREEADMHRGKAAKIHTCKHFGRNHVLARYLERGIAFHELIIGILTRGTGSQNVKLSTKYRNECNRFWSTPIDKITQVSIRCYSRRPPPASWARQIIAWKTKCIINTISIRFARGSPFWCLGIWTWDARRQDHFFAPSTPIAGTDRATPL